MRAMPRVLLITSCGLMLVAVPAHSDVVVGLRDPAPVTGSSQKLGSVPVSSVASQSVRAVLSKHGCSSLRRLFADRTRFPEWVTARTGEIVQMGWPTTLYSVSCDSATGQALLSELASNPDVYCLAHDTELKSSVVPNDAFFAQQWGLLNLGQNGGTAGQDINVSGAWNDLIGASPLGVLDIGHVDRTHPEFVGRVSTEQQNPIGLSHPTLVAGVAAAMGNNGVGVAGVSWASPIHSRTISNNSVVGQQTFEEGTWLDFQGFQNAGAYVVNHSWYQEDPGNAFPLELIFAKAYMLNFVNVTAAGNEGANPVVYPPTKYIQEVLSVGAVDRFGAPASFTSLGPHVDLAAPGEEIITTNTGSPAYLTTGGTSLAAPFVAGAAALLLSRNPSLYNDDIEHLLKLSARDITSPPAGSGVDQATGYGMIDVGAAMAMMSPPNTLLHSAIWIGGSVTSTTVNAVFFMGVPNIEPGWYPNVRRREVQRTVSFPIQFEVPPNVWGRGVASTGLGPWQINFGVGFCEPVAGTITTTGCVLRTYVYEIIAPNGSLYATLPPGGPDAVNYAYTVQGNPVALTASISGDAALNCSDAGTWTANPVNGYGSYTYEWHAVGQPAILGTTKTIHQASPVGENSFHLYCNVSSGDESQQAHYLVAWGCSYGDPSDPPPGGEYVPCIPKPCPARVSIEALSNPARGELRFAVSLSRESDVEVEIFDTSGRRVGFVHQGPLKPGRSLLSWQTREIAAGIYLARMRAGGSIAHARVIVVK